MGRGNGKGKVVVSDFDCMIVKDTSYNRAEYRDRSFKDVEELL